MDVPRSSYVEKREQALRRLRADLGIEAPTAAAPVWAVLMEWVAPQAIATGVAYLDGGASLFFSEGTLLPGDTAPGSEALLQSVAALHECANNLRHLLQPADHFPLPRTGHVQFFMRTDAGVLAATARESDFQVRRHGLWRLYFAAHEVTAALYHLDELRYRQRHPAGPGGGGDQSG